LLLIWLLWIWLRRLHPRIRSTRPRAESLRVLAIPILLPILLLNLDCVLQWRLVRGREKTATISAGIVDKLPLVVVAFFVEFANRFVFAGTGYSYDWQTAKALTIARTWLVTLAAGTLRRISRPRPVLRGLICV
jgi:hypothetical protein